MKKKRATLRAIQQRFAAKTKKVCRLLFASEALPFAF